MTDITKLAIQVVAKDSLDDGMAKVNANLVRQAKTMERTLASPVQEAERALAALIRHTDRLSNKANYSILSDREVEKLALASRHLDAIQQRLQMTGGGFFPGFQQVQQNIGLVGQNLAQAQQLGIRQPPSALFNQIRDWEYLGATTRGPVDRTVDPMREARIQRNLMLRDPRAYQNWWQGVLADRDNQEVDLDRMFNRRNVIDRNAGIIIRRHQETAPTFRDDELWRARLSAADARNRDPYSGNQTQDFSRAQLANAQSLTKEYQNQEKVVDRLRSVFARMSVEDRQAARLQANAYQASGIDRTTRLRALGQNEYEFAQARMRTGMGSSSHALRYGIQNAGYAVEDFLVSSQYGGPKAGLRAIANNLTAVAAASTMSMNPWIAGAAITGTAIGSAALPFAVNAFTGSDERTEELNAQFSSPRNTVMRQFEMQQRNRATIGSGIAAARQSLDATTKAMQRREALSGEIMRGISPELRRQAGENVSWTERFFAGANNLGMVDMQGNPGLIAQTIGGAVSWADWMAGNRVNWSRTRVGGAEQIRRIDDARGRLDAANKNMSGLDDPELLHRQQSDERAILDRERRIQAGEFRVQDALSPREFEIARRQMRGAIVDPQEQFEIDQAKRFGRWGNLRQNLAGDPERLRDEGDAIKREQLLARRQLDFDKEEFTLRRRDRDWAFRGEMADLQTDPRKTLAERFQIRKEQIQADQSITPIQQNAQITALDKVFKKQLERINDYPALGDAIDVGSAADVRLRQKYFDRSGGTGSQSDDSRRLGEIVQELRGLREDMRKNQPKVSTVKGR